MMVADVCMFFISFFLTLLVWSLTNRIKKIELTNKAQWETISRVWAEIRANKKRIVALEKDGDHHEGRQINKP